ncbi:MAG: glycosyltransferase, partial [Flavobacterium sp.]
MYLTESIHQTVMTFDPVQKVSIIIPAYNAASTIEHTLNSIQVQTFKEWEVVLIDDGSTDDTYNIVHKYAAADERIKIYKQVNKGVSAARNVGIALAKHEWLLLLDSDDTIAPNHLRLLTKKLQAEKNLDAVVCGWRVTLPNGGVGPDMFPPFEKDLFPFLTVYCCFAIHCCLFKKSLLNNAGNFDESLNVCEDWDLWQRIARTGAQFGFVTEALAFYKSKTNDSLSRNVTNFFSSALRVVRQGHSFDKRVKFPIAKYKDGSLALDLVQHELYLASWCAGMYIYNGRDATFLLNEIQSIPIYLDLQTVTKNLIQSVCHSACILPIEFHNLWDQIEPGCAEFFTALGHKTKNHNIYHQMLLSIAKQMEPSVKKDKTLNIGNIHVSRLDISEPILDLYPPATAVCLLLIVDMENSYLGEIELPICDQFVPAWLIKDSIAFEFSWSIMGRFFENTIYRNSKEKYINELSLSLQELHDSIGWKTYINQLWGDSIELPLEGQDSSNSPFFQIFRKILGNSSVSEARNRIIIEVSKPFKEITTEAKSVDVLVTVGGINFCMFTTNPKSKIIKVDELKEQIEIEGGYELFRVCVREALIGQSLQNPICLRKRLAALAQQRAKDNTFRITHGLLDQSNKKLSRRNDFIFGRKHGPLNSSASRRTVMPSNAAPELLELAKITKEVIAKKPLKWVHSSRIFYVPEIFRQTSTFQISATAKPALYSSTKEYNRHHFENLFAKKQDPWAYTH